MFNKKGHNMKYSKSIIGIAILFLVVSCAVGPLISSGEIFKNLTQITDGDGTNYDPVISPDGIMILFVSERDGNSNIYLKTDINSKSVIKRTEHLASELSPSFSNDGEKFCFASNTNGNYDIFYMNTKTGFAKTQITSSQNDELFPCWSPVEDVILYSQFAMGEWYIWSKNLLNGQNTQICKGVLAKYSNDGKSFYYRKHDKNKYYQLWKINIDGNSDTQLTSGEDWGVGSYAIAPIGDKVIFSTTNLNLSIMNQI